jgi:hypothetical protein
LRNSKFEKVTNPLNEDKPLKICRDGQEVPKDIGRRVCLAFDALESPRGKKAFKSKDQKHPGVE